jgi:glutamyl-tRNA synthetase
VDTCAPISIERVRVRFAPSPTGVLHIGGARTALYNWLLARRAGGTFVLRIEDTDRERSTPENVEQILDALRWLELGWDEGPYSQAERAPAHTEAIEQLLAGGHAYVDEGAVRLRVPDEGETVIHDQIRGDISFPHSSIDDFVIRRSDGSALYNLAVAVDDRDMGITQVIRGEDHVSNTPRQVMILRALGEEPPAYAHLPLLHGPDGKKLSKRHGAASVQELREAGYLPEAVRNYIALLGWGYDEATTFFTTDELIERFDLSRVSKNPAVFDEQKLRWMNGRYLRELSPEDLEARLEERLGREIPAEAVAISQEKMQTLADFWPLAGFLVEPREFDEQAWARVMGDGAPERLRAAREALEAADGFDPDAVERALRGVVERLDVKPKEVFQPVRVAISGSTVSPGIFESVAALGRDETLARIDEALRKAAAV